MDSFLMHLNSARLFFEYLKNCGLNYSYDEINDLTSYENYSRLLDSIESFDKTPPKANFFNIPPSTVFDVSMGILNTIFGCIINEKLVADISTRILTNNKDNIYNGSVICGESISDKKLLFDRLDTTTSIPVFTHEVTHYLFDDTPIFSNIHTLDILAILVELITADRIGERKIDDITKYAIYVARIEDLKETHKVLTTYYPFYKEHIDDEYALNLIQIFAKHTTYKYTYSFMSVYNLFLCYKDDKKKFNLELRKLINDKNSITTILEYYDISLKSHKSTDNTIKLINSL